METVSIPIKLTRESELRPMAWPELIALFGLPTLLNLIACRLKIPFLDGQNWMPIEVGYFLSVGLLVLVPMFLGAIYLAGRDIRSYRSKDILVRMRVKKLTRTDWAWTVGSFVLLSLCSFLIAKVLMPSMGWNATPFFFKNMPLESHHLWILAVWPLYFFFNIFGEEFLWRGYIQPRQELLNGKWTWFVQGIFWSIWHLPMGLGLVLSSLPLLFILPAIVHIRQNTSISIVVHAIFGGFGFLALALGLVH